MTTAARTRPLARPANPRAVRLRRRLSVAARLALLAVLLGLTAWEMLRRPALREAEDAFRSAEAMTKKDSRREAAYRNALRLALDDLASHRGAPTSSLIAARSLSKLGYGDLAEPHYFAAGSVVKSDPSLVDERAQGLVISNRLDAAATVCRDYLGSLPDDTSILRSLAYIEWLQGKYPEAQATAEHLARLPKGRAEGLGLLATVLHDAKHPEQAVPVFQELLAIDPELKAYPGGPAVFWREFTDDLVQLHRSAEARDYLVQVVGLYPDTALLEILGWAQKELGDLDAAEDSFRKAILRSPNRVNPRLQLGRLLVGAKRFGDAVEVLEPAVKLEPNNLDCHYVLSTAYKFLGKAADAERHAARAEEIRRASPDQGGGMGPAP